MEGNGSLSLVRYHVAGPGFGDPIPMLREEGGMTASNGQPDFAPDVEALLDAAGERFRDEIIHYFEERFYKIEGQFYHYGVTW